MNLILHYPPTPGEPYTMFRYPGGEVQVRLDNDIQMRMKDPVIEVITVVARVTDGDIVPVAQLINAIRGTTSADIKLVLPYLPYSRADRRFVGGDTLGLQVFGQLLNTLAGVEIVTLDVHSDAAAKYIRHFTNIKANQIIHDVQRSLAEDNPGKIVSVLLPDKGASRYGITSAYWAEKQRDPSTGKLSGFRIPNPPANDQIILIVDDICDGGGTFIGIAQELKKQQFNGTLYLYVTHGIFSKGMSELKQYFTGVFCTDSFRVKEAYGEPGFLTVLKCEPLLTGEK